MNNLRHETPFYQVEIEKVPETAYIFDVDGVITNPIERKITHPKHLKHITALLTKGEPVGLVSGRALPWIKEQVVIPLQGYIRENKLDDNILDNLYVSGEFGGSVLTFKDGLASDVVDSGLRLDSNLVQKAGNITKSFSQFVFIDPEKQTQFTAEMQRGIDMDDFHKHVGAIANAYKEIVDELGLSDKLEVHQDRIAINIKYKIANKAHSVSEFLSWLQQKKILPKHYKVFGDSPSDLEMGDELKSHNLSFDFIYVGNPEGIQRKMDFSPFFTQVEFGKETDEGTLEYLERNI